MLETDRDATITDLTLRGGSALYGGGINVAGGAVTVHLNDLVIDNNEAITIDGPGGDGGGIYADELSHVYLDNVQVTNNSADNNGGGIFVNFDAIVELSNGSTVSGNTAYTGGGLYVHETGGEGVGPGSATVTGSSIERNTAYLRGGGVFVGDSATLTLTDSLVSTNHAGVVEQWEGVGGGIYAEFSTITATRTSINDNNAVQIEGGGIGGGILLYIGDAHLTDVTISGNHADREGGGVYVDGGGEGGTVYMNRVTVDNNDASYGGGMYLIGDTANLTNVTVSGNQAVNSGGGIYVDDVGTANLTHVTVADNTSESVAGIDVGVNTGIANLTNVLLAGNSGDNCGGTPFGIAGDNISDDATCPAGVTTVTDAMLGPLADNGGETQTQALLPGSPAIDAVQSHGRRDGLHHARRGPARHYASPGHLLRRGRLRGEDG